MIYILDEMLFDDFKRVLTIKTKTKMWLIDYEHKKFNKFKLLDK